MTLDFDFKRWEKIKETYSLWWKGKLGRPIFPISLYGRVPEREEPKTPLLTQATCSDFSISPEDVIDRIDYELSKIVFLGDAFPCVDMTAFGPGVVAAFLGAELDNSSGNVWFHPREDLPISEINLEYDPDNKWLQRIKDIYAAGMKRWQGRVMMSMTDLGGSLDILASFRPGEGLLMDLVLAPDEVKRLNWETHDLWHRFYNELNDILRPDNPGYVGWAGIFSDKPTYILQCDFSYMIAPKMFDEFVLPELQATSERLSRSVYHVDGTGQLPHIDSLLSIESLDGLQWICGVQEEKHGHHKWHDLYRKINDAGKKIQLHGFNGFDEIDAVIKAIGGNADAIHHLPFMLPIEREADIRKGLENMVSNKMDSAFKNI